jgi:arsenate reductase (glutaredoxin)
MLFQPFGNLMTLTLYGIPNCDTVKKARMWLDAYSIAYAFHDYKKLGVEKAMLTTWCEALGWESVLNRAGTTFKQLAEADKADITQTKAISLMQAQPSMIKRPIAHSKTVLLAGFKPDIYESTFS